MAVDITLHSSPSPPLHSLVFSCSDSLPPSSHQHVHTLYEGSLTWMPVTKISLEYVRCMCSLRYVVYSTYLYLKSPYWFPCSLSVSLYSNSSSTRAGTPSVLLPVYPSAQQSGWHTADAQKLFVDFFFFLFFFVDFLISSIFGTRKQYLLRTIIKSNCRVPETQK